jgi:uncharacterized protein (TIGR03435 family)
LTPLANHLWQSTLFAAVAWLLALALRQNRAPVRYWIWMAASVKFLIPFSLLVSAGGQLGWRTAPAIAHSQFSFAMDEIGQPFAVTASAPLPAVAAPAQNPLPAILFGAWLCGIAIGAIFWMRLWRQIRAARRGSTPLDLKLPIAVMSSPGRLEPGVVGIFRPVLLLPEGITERLTPPQLEAILAHELRHVERRDNLTAAVHMLVETIFWFHPLAWWIRTRLMEERERACDEGVLRLGSEPQVYAESILKVCEFYLAPPVACAAGVTGGELKKRIEGIMTNRFASKLTYGKKLLLAAVALAVVAAPIAIGLMNPLRGRAQAQSAPRLSFEAASVKLAGPEAKPTDVETGGPGTNDPGMFRAPGIAMFGLLYDAFGVGTDQYAVPAWIRDLRSGNRYSIVATVPPHATKEQFQQMLQNLLVERFHLVFHHETRGFPGYALVVDKGGPKFKEVTPTPGGDPDKEVERGALEAAPKDARGFPELPGSYEFAVSNRDGRTWIKYQERTMAQFISRLGFMMANAEYRRAIDGFREPRIVDKTGLTGRYTFVLEYYPEGLAHFLPPVVDPDTGKASPAFASDPEGGSPSISVAIREQLGLRLDKTADVPVDVIVVDSVDKVPTAN